MARESVLDSSVSADPTQPLQAPVQAVRSPASRRGVVAWTLVASVLLAGAGLVRTVQSRVYQEADSYKIGSPFPLNKIAHTFGGWHLVPGSISVLDPMTTRITGSTDHVIGSYVDELTGVMVSVLVLYGPAEPVLPHIPEVCYPSSGFKLVGEIKDRTIPVEGQSPAIFRTNEYIKSGGRSLIHESVYYSFRSDGSWKPSVATGNTPRRNAGIFKIQIQRRMAPSEKGQEGDPIEDFLQHLIPSLEAQIAEAEAKSVPPRTTPSA